MKRVFEQTLRWLCLATLACLPSGCSSNSGANNGPGRRLAGALVITGSSTVAPLAAEMGRRFEQIHPDVRIDVQTGGSSRGIADVQGGTAAIGMVSRELKMGEQQLYAHRVAVDGICMIVHRDNPVLSLTDEQVVSIFLGGITNWRGARGDDKEIVVVNKAAGRGTLEVFVQHFAIDQDAIQADLIVGDNQQAIKTVAGNPQAIAYVSIGAADYEARHGATIKLLKAAEIAPTRENVAKGKFPITRPLNFVTENQPVGLAKAFIEFAQSPEVHDLVEAHYFVPIQR